MLKAIILVNGLKIPYHVFEHAYGLIKGGDDELEVFFLFQVGEKMEQYTFPSDIEKAETFFSEREADEQLRQLIRNNEQYTERQAKRLGIKVKTNFLNNPTLDELGNAVEHSATILIDADNFKHPRDIANADIKYEDLVDRFGERLKEIAFS